jgi:nodulation protein E
MVQGEGAGVFVLETYEGAKARGAEILAEIVGFAMTSDASDIVMPNQQGAAARHPWSARAMRVCLRKILAISTPMALELRRMTKRNVRR